MKRPQERLQPTISYGISERPNKLPYRFTAIKQAHSIENEMKYRGLCYTTECIILSPAYSFAKGYTVLWKIFNKNVFNYAIRM